MLVLLSCNVLLLEMTNINEWFIFDATLFDRLFAQNKNLVKQFNDFEGGRLAETKTDFFYKQIAGAFVETPVYQRQQAPIFFKLRSFYN